LRDPQRFRSRLEALKLLEGIERAGDLEQYAPFHLARADMFRRLGRGDEARESYRRALQFASNDQVRRFIEQRLHGADAESRAKGLV